MKNGDVIDVNKRYEITCRYCGKVQYACLSILHTWGIAEGGRGKCQNCKKIMTLVFDYDAEEMTAKEAIINILWGEKNNE